jgi:DNA-3-methyladenine glycosylase
VRAGGRERELCSGPGKLTQALGVSLAENDTSLSSGPVRIGPRVRGWEDPPVLAGTRVGISRAVELPWRFCVEGCGHVSRPRPRREPGGRVGSAAGRDAAGR